MSVFTQMQHTRWLFISIHFIFGDIDFLNKNVTPPNGLPLKDIQLHFIKKNAFCLKTSHFINKYDSPRSQLCQWPRLVHNCNQSFNPWPIVARFDSNLNIPASHLGIPGGIENLDLQY